MSDLLCQVCGQRIANPDRAWPQGTADRDVRYNGTVLTQAHIGCYRLAREYGDRDKIRVVK